MNGFEIKTESEKFVVKSTRRPLTQLQNRSFHVVDWTKAAVKCTKMKNAQAKRAKLLFHVDRYANL